MFAAALIVFRETLEASLIIAIIMAATRGVAGRGRWISLGILGGAIGATLVAELAQLIADAAAGTGQELLNAGILCTAVTMISWHVIWMARHGRTMASEMKAVGHSVASGSKHLSMLALVVSLAVMREGSELVLMLQGLFVGQARDGLFRQFLVGLAAGGLTGVLLYTGFLALPIRRVFQLTNGLLILIAAGMAARAANFLVQAGLLPPLRDRVWDTSSIISEQSTLGQILATLTGYIAHPSGMQLLSYGATLIVILSLLAWQSPTPQRVRKS